MSTYNFIKSDKNEDFVEAIGTTWDENGAFYTPDKFIKYKGYYFLIYILGKLLEGEYRSFSKELYPLVALEFGMKESSIERDIRYAIEVGYNRTLLSINDNSIPSAENFILPACKH